MQEVINLSKGQTIDLRKNSKGESVYDLSQVTIGLGWDVRQKESGFLGKLFGGNKEEEYDLDAIAFLLDENGKVANLGRTVQVQNGQQKGLFEGDVIFFNSLKHPSGHIWLTGDNRTGDGDGDDEQIIVKLNSLSNDYHKIVFIVQIYEGAKNNQHFGQVQNAFIRAVDASGKEMVRFNLSGKDQYDQQRSLLFAELVRESNGWKFNALGSSSASDNFVEWLKKYV